MKTRLLRTDVQFPTLLLYCFKEYSFFLEDSMNHSHLVWMDFFALITNTAPGAQGSCAFPDPDRDGQPGKGADIGI